LTVRICLKQFAADSSRHLESGALDLTEVKRRQGEQQDEPQETQYENGPDHEIVFPSCEFFRYGPDF
jgi:hypothetical protein